MNVKIFRMIDKYFFWTLILLFFWLKYIFIYKKNVIRIHPKKILVIRLRALGSSLLTFPMIKQLRDHYGEQVQYDFLASSRNIWIFKNQWYFQNMYNLFRIKDVIKLFLSFKKYDIVIDAEEYFKVSSLISLRTGKLTIGYNNLWIRKLTYTNPVYYIPNEHNLINCISLLNPLDIKGYRPHTMESLKYTEKDTIKVNEFLQKYRNKKIICMHTWGAETSPDRFRPQENWITLIKKLIHAHWEDVVILLSGTKFEEEWVKEILNQVWSIKNIINICWNFNLFEFAYLLGKCDLMISNDTWPMHLATCMWTKTIGLFGPNLPERFGPWPLDKNISLYKWNGKIAVRPELGRFIEDKQNAIEKISVAEVLSHLEI